MPDLAHAPLKVKASWVFRTVTTDPPRLVPHTEYALQFKFYCESVILPVMILRDACNTQFSRTWRSQASQTLCCRLSFFPFDWRNSNQVQVNLEGLRTVVSDSNFKHDPRPFLDAPLLNQQEGITTGAVIQLATILLEPRIDASLLVIAKSDTQAKRGRWALKHDVAPTVSAELDFLRSGHISGQF